MRNSIKKGVRRSIRLLNVKKGDVVVVRCPNDFFNKLIPFFKLKFKGLDVSFINLNEYDDIVTLDREQLLILKEKIENALEQRGSL